MKMNWKKSIYLLPAMLGMLVNQYTNAQDVHFSQFNLNPMAFNPGLAGVVNADFRATVSYRDQWNGVAPFTTYYAAADGKIKQKNSDNIFTLGGLISKDKAGDLELGTFNASLHLGYMLALDNNSELTFGMSGGLLQRSLNGSAMIWDDQYVNGSYSAANPTSETTNYSPVSALDFGAGLAYSYSKSTSTLSSNDHFDLIVGAGVMHANRPVISLAGGDDPLPMKLTGNVDLNLGIVNTNFSVRPGLLYSRQGPHQELVLGSYWSILVQEGSKRTGFLSVARVSLGTHYRTGDAFIPSILMELAEYKLSISYDVNVSGLSPATGGQGGIEFTFIYTNPATFYYKRKRRGTSFL